MKHTGAHALVVGGTGMLRGVSLYLAEKGHVVSVVARSRERLESLAGVAVSSLRSTRTRRSPS